MAQHNPQCLTAGLDIDSAVLLHVDSLNPSNFSPAVSRNALEDIPYVTIHKVGRAGRIPFADKSHDFANLSIDSENGTSCTILVYEDASKESRRSPSRPKPCRVSTSFHPLPPVPSASSLQLPSFLDYSYHTIAPPPEPPSERTSPVPSPATELRLPSLSQPLFPPPEEPKGVIEYAIPALQHPNSPYVPWEPPVRQAILRPLSTVARASSCYSRPYSRSGAQAPEPMFLNEHDDRCVENALEVSKTWGALRRIVCSSIKHVKRSIARTLKKSPRAASPGPPTPKSRHQVSLEYAIFHDPEQTTHLFASPALPSPSAPSFDSTHTNSLATWLNTRRRECEEHVPRTLMTLDEYERAGSWLDLSQTTEGSDMACETLAMPSSEGEPTTPIKQRPSASQSLHEIDSASRRTILSPQSPHSRSVPQLPMQRGCFDSLDHIASFSRDDKRFRHGREMSMPGGWTFST